MSAAEVAALEERVAGLLQRRKQCVQRLDELEARNAAIRAQFASCQELQADMLLGQQTVNSILADDEISGTDWALMNSIALNEANTANMHCSKAHLPALSTAVLLGDANAAQVARLRRTLCERRRYLLESLPENLRRKVQQAFPEEKDDSTTTQYKQSVSANLLPQMLATAWRLAMRNDEKRRVVVASLLASLQEFEEASHDAKQIDTDRSAQNFGFSLRVADAVAARAEQHVRADGATVRADGSENDQENEAEDWGSWTRYGFFDGDDSDVIFFGKNGDRRVIKALTLDKLVEKATPSRDAGVGSARHNVDMLDILLLAWPTFTTAEALFGALKRRFDVPPPPGVTKEELGVFASQYRTAVQLRVTNCLKNWLLHYWTRDFEPRPQLVEQVSHWVHSLQQRPERAARTMGATLAKTLGKRGQRLRVAGELTEAAIDARAPPLRMPMETTWLTFGEASVDVVEVARQLTLVDFDLFRRLHRDEFLHKNWTRADKAETAPNIVALTERSNDIARWVTARCVQQAEQRERVRVVRKFIALARELRQRQNYSACLAVVSGLNANATHRLRLTWRDTSSRDLGRLEQLKKLQSSSGGMAAMRSALSDALASSQPSIPFLGVALQEVFQAYEKAKLVSDIPDGFFDFSRASSLAASIERVLRHQRLPYVFRRHERLQQFLADEIAETRKLTVDELDAMSRRIETRDMHVEAGLVHG